MKPIQPPPLIEEPMSPIFLLANQLHCPKFKLLGELTESHLPVQDWQSGLEQLCNGDVEMNWAEWIYVEYLFGVLCVLKMDWNVDMEHFPPSIKFDKKFVKKERF